MAHAQRSRVVRDLPNLIYDLEPLDSGLEIYVELVITDYAGNVSAQGGFVTLP